MTHIYKRGELYGGTAPETRGKVAEFRLISGEVCDLPKNVRNYNMLIAEVMVHDGDRVYRDTLPMEYVREAYGHRIYK